MTFIEVQTTSQRGKTYTRYECESCNKIVPKKNHNSHVVDCKRTPDFLDNLGNLLSLDCGICMENRHVVEFATMFCGHKVCFECRRKLSSICPFCRLDFHLVIIEHDTYKVTLTYLQGKAELLTFQAEVGLLNNNSLGSILDIKTEFNEVSIQMINLSKKYPTLEVDELMRQRFKTRLLIDKVEIAIKEFTSEIHT